MNYRRISKQCKLNVIHAYANRKRSGIMVKAIASHHHISRSRLYDIVYAYEKKHNIKLYKTGRGGYRKHPNHVNQYK